MTRLRLFALAALFLAAGALATSPYVLAAPAQEASDWLQVVGPVPLFGLTDLAPGATGRAELTVTNRMPLPARFAIQVVDLRSDDAGCNEPEREAGDTTCGQGGGELADVLDVTLVAVTRDGMDRTLRSDTLGELDGVPVRDEEALHPGEQRTYAVSYELRGAATNVAQSDRLSFDLALELEQASGADVAGATTRRAQVAAAPRLPTTGNELLDMMRLGAGAVAIGCLALVVASRRRERRTQIA
jgi:hypothetical protein